MPSNEGFGDKGLEMGLDMKKNAIPTKLLATDETDNATRADVASQLKGMAGIDA